MSPGNPSSGIALRGLEVARGTDTLVRGLDLFLPKGTFTSVLGASGVGKSSLLATLAGMLPPRSGEVQFHEGHNGGCLPTQCRRSMGLVFQHLNLSLNASAQTNVLCGVLGRRSWLQTLFGFPRSDHRRAEVLLNALGLSELGPVPVSSISGGERQRVALARALLQEPSWLFADEPISHLDSELARSIMTHLKQQCHERHATVICVLHDRQIAEEFSDHILLLKGGGKWEIQKS